MSPPDQTAASTPDPAPVVAPVAAPVKVPPGGLSAAAIEAAKAAATGEAPPPVVTGDASSAGAPNPPWVGGKGRGKAAAATA